MENCDLTYENWWNGKVNLVETYKSYHPSKVNAKLFERSILSFPEKEAEKIQLKQKELFILYVTDLSNRFIEDFNERFTKSPSPLDMIHLEATRIVGVIKGGHIKQGTDYIYFHYANLVIPKDALSNFQNYLNSRLEGRETKPSSVPSPNSPFYDKGHLIPEVYVESLIKVYMHLGKFDTSIQLKKLFSAPFKMIYGREPKNPNSDIFTSGWGYRAFSWCEELIIQKNNSITGDYAHILKVLKHDGVNAILKKVTHNDFIAFINKSRKLNLNTKTSKPSTHALKENSFKYVLRRYLLHLEIVDQENVDEYVRRVIEQKST